MIKASDFITKVQGVTAKAGYILKDSDSSSVLYFFNLSDSSVIPLDSVYLPDTQVPQPQYYSSNKVSATEMYFYKCSAVNSDSTWSGYKLIQNTDNGYTLQSESTVVGVYYVRPAVDKIYDSTGKLQLKTYYSGDTYDPYGDGLLYSIFINGGTGWSAPSYGAVTTDNYTSNVETVYGVTARKFNGSQQVTATGGESRTIWSYSVWLYGTGDAFGQAPVEPTGIIGIIYRGDTGRYGCSRPDTSYGVHSYLSEAQAHWIHVVVTYDGTTWNIYLNGALDYSYSFSIGSHSSFAFGRNPYTGAGEYYRGYIANFRFYDHVLTSSEIAALYAELTPTSN